MSRGIGIILVVYGHVLRGNFSANPPAWAVAQDEIIYAFHMPLFFMLSGLFLWASLGRHSFLASRWRQLIYPYLLWSLITVAIEIVLASYVNSPLSLRDAALIPFVPLEQYWFLYALLVCQLVALLAYPRKWLLLLLGALGLGGVLVFGGGWIVPRSFLYLPFVMLGIFGRRAFEQLSLAPRHYQALAAGAAWAAFVALWTSGIKGIFLLGAAGSIGTAAIGMLASSSSVLAALGRASLAIYLLHTIFSAGTRIMLSLLGIAPSSLCSVFLSLVAGIVLPYGTWCWAKLTDRTRLLGFEK